MNPSSIKNTVSPKKEYLFTILMLLTAFACMLTFAMVTPFGDGPDEINRYKVVTYIIEHGTIPSGTDPGVVIDGYGGSYAFQPMLTYMIDGFLLRALSFLSLNFETQLLLARLVNICFGLIMAVYVRKTARLLFSNGYASWAFTLAVVFLPQNLFVHSYVNTDSMGFLSVAMIIYALILGMHKDFNLPSLIHLSLGIILCALSYYNCYGIVLCAVFLFILHFFRHRSNEHGKQILYYDYKPFFIKSGIVCLVVLLGISWWFIRNGILYHGDFLALDARQEYAALTCTPEYNPFTRDTYQRMGIPVLTMIFGTDYYTLVWKSFIAMFGPMIIPTHHYIYMGFKYWLIAALLGLVLPQRTDILPGLSKGQRITFNILMVFAMVLPGALAVYYSYTWEFQPQGRYFLPLLIPFMYFLTVGIQKLFSAITSLLCKLNQKAERAMPFLLYHFLYAFLTFSLLYSVFIAFLRYYRQS